MNGPFVSIIVPVFNVEKYIEECIASIASQTYKNIELVLVDDRGIDNSIEIAVRYLERKSNDIHYRIIRHSYNRGIAAARNSGVASVHNGFILFVDSDDYLASSDVVERLVKRQIETDADVVTANSTMFDDVTGKIYNVVDADYTDAFYENREKEPCIKLGGVAWNKLIRTDFIKHNDLYFDEGIVFEDITWVYKVSCSSPRIATMSDKLYMYRYRQGSIMNTLTERHILSKIQLPILCYEWLYTHSTLKKAFAAEKIEDMKQGAYYALQSTGNEALFPDLYQLYKDKIGKRIIDLSNFRLSLKVLLSYFPKPIFLALTKLRSKKAIKEYRQLDLDKTIFEKICHQ